MISLCAVHLTDSEKKLPEEKQARIVHVPLIKTMVRYDYTNSRYKIYPNNHINMRIVTVTRFPNKLLIQISEWPTYDKQCN